MSDQIDLLEILTGRQVVGVTDVFGSRRTPEVPPPPSPLEEKFRAFHADNPHVYTQLKDLALKMRRTGRERYGIKSLFEVMRWHRALRTTEDDFKLNNNYTSFYARLLMEREPELGGFFNTRKRTKGVR
jgi:hypothetical protein